MNCKCFTYFDYFSILIFLRFYQYNDNHINAKHVYLYKKKKESVMNVKLYLKNITVLIYLCKYLDYLP